MMHRPHRFLPALATFLLIGGAAQAASAKAGWEESGEASWYGARHHGQRTASGEVFDKHAMTAAHATLPLGSMVRVTVQDTGASVVVEITDRQPRKRYRVIDLSRGAAARIGIVQRGTAMVTVEHTDDEPLEVAEAPDDEGYEGPLNAGSLRPRGQPRMRPAGRVGGANRSCCHARSATPARR